MNSSIYLRCTPYSVGGFAVSNEFAFNMYSRNLNLFAKDFNNSDKYSIYFLRVEKGFKPPNVLDKKNSNYDAIE